MLIWARKNALRQFISLSWAPAPPSPQTSFPYNLIIFIFTITRFLYNLISNTWIMSTRIFSGVMGQSSLIYGVFVLRLVLYVFCICVAFTPQTIKMIPSEEYLHIIYFLIICITICYDPDMGSIQFQFQFRNLKNGNGIWERLNWN